MAKHCIDCGYPLKGLGEARCPECGLSFDASDPSSYTTERAGVHRHAVLAASFSGAILGWSLGYAVNAVASGYWPGWAYSVKGEAFSTLCTVLAWWLVLVLPLLSSRRVLEALKTRRTTPLVGIAWALVGLWLLRGWGFVHGVQVGVFWGLNVWAVLVGFCAGAAVRLIISRRATRSAAGLRAGMVVGLWLLGPVAVAGWVAWGWPLTCRFAPNFAVRIGDDETTEKLLRRTLEDVRVGDRVEQLYDRLPAYFGGSRNTPQDGQWGYTVGGYHVFTMEVQDGVIRDVYVFPKR